MPLTSFVKVSHLTNLSDARYCSGMGVNLLGFGVIPGQEHFLDPQRYQDIRGWVSGPGIVAELYGISTAADLSSVVSAYAPDYFELSYDVYAEYKDVLTLPCIVHLRDGNHDLGTIARDPRIAYLLVDEPATCADVQAPYPTLVKVSDAQVLEQKRAAGCFAGFALEAPREIRPGVTNYEELGGILEALESDD